MTEGSNVSSWRWPGRDLVQQPSAVGRLTNTLKRRDETGVLDTFFRKRSDFEVIIKFDFKVFGVSAAGFPNWPTQRRRIERSLLRSVDGLPRQKYCQQQEQEWRSSTHQSEISFGPKGCNSNSVAVRDRVPSMPLRG